MKNTYLKMIKMDEISFIGSPAKHGDYFIFQIPNKLIKKGLVNPNATFSVVLRPIKSIKVKNTEPQNQIETIPEEIL